MFRYYLFCDSCKITGTDCYSRDIPIRFSFKLIAMQEILDLRKEDSFPLKAGLPADYRGIILQGSVSFSGETPSGLIVLQNFQRPGFSIRLGIYKFLRVVHCFLQPPLFPSGSIHSLKSDLKSRIPGVGSFTLRENQFNFIHYGKEVLLADFKAEKEYQLLDVSCSPGLTDPFRPFFPGLLEKFREKTNDPSAAIITLQRKAGRHAGKILRELLQSPFAAGVNEDFINDKIREYVWLLMIEATKTEIPRVPLTDKMIGQLTDIGRQMRETPHERFPIPKLARMMGMNDMTFKMAFKQIFGKGVLEYHLDHRMNEARRLLKEGMNIKTVAAMTGYDLSTSFITKFIEYFGYGPSKIQLKK
jgi:AraC-like DNA-binding protein